MNMWLVEILYMHYSHSKLYCCPRSYSYVSHHMSSVVYTPFIFGDPHGQLGEYLNRIESNWPIWG